MSALNFPNITNNNDNNDINNNDNNNDSHHVIANHKSTMKALPIQSSSITITIIMLTLISIVCWWSYYPSLNNEFVFDDDLAIVNNADVRPGNDNNNNNVSAWYLLWQHDIWGKHLLAHDSHRSYRPLLIMIFKAIANQFGLQPRVYRLFSIGFHNLVSILVFYLTRELFRNEGISFGSAMLFASHPVHVESVAAVVNMAEALSAVLYITVFIIFIRMASSSIVASTSIISQVIAMLGCMILLFGSILFKETGVTVCGLILIQCVINFITQAVITRQVQPKQTFGSIIIRWAMSHWIWIYFSISGVILYILLRLSLVGMNVAELGWYILSFNSVAIANILSKAYLGESQLIRKAENPFAFLETRMEKILSYMYLHFRYFWLLLYPAEQCAEYSYDCIPKVSSLDDPRNICSFCTYAILIALCLVGFVMLFAFNRVCRIDLGTKRALDVDEKSIIQSIDSNSKENLGSQPIQKATDIPDVHSSVADSSADDISPAISSIDSSINVTNQDTLKATSTQDFYFPGLNFVPSDDPFWIVSSSGLLSAMAWILVPFLPMSGIFLRLGTLLAERLLYVPSIGFCMLLAYLGHLFIALLYSLVLQISSISSGNPPREPLPGKSHYYAPRTLLLCALLAAVHWSIDRTQVYCETWKNPESLFIKGLSVCPRSAKMNLQVAKLYVNRGEYKQGRKHVEAAEKIDPEFCDVGYQKALLAVFYDNDIDEGMRLASSNLNCPFSSTGSLELLTKLMDLQIKESPRNHVVLARQGDLLLDASMFSAAIQKFQAAVTISFENHDFKNTLKYSLKAERAVNKVLAETNLIAWNEHRSAIAKSRGKNMSTRLHQVFDGDSGANQLLGRDHACFVDMLGGGTRLHILKALNNSKTSTNKDVKKLPKFSKDELTELHRGKYLLMRAVQPGCVVFDRFSKRLQSAHSENAVNMLSEALISQFKLSTQKKSIEEYDVALIEEFSRFSYISSQMFLVLNNVTQFKLNRDGGEQQKKSVVASGTGKFDADAATDRYKRSAVDLAGNAVEMWMLAGKLNFHKNRFADANEYFELAMQWGLVGVEEQVHGMIGAPCSAAYWLAHSTAALETFLVDKEQQTKIVTLLEQYRNCKDTHQSATQYKIKASKQLEILRKFAVGDNKSS